MNFVASANLPALLEEMIHVRVKIVCYRSTVSRNAELHLETRQAM